MTASIVKCVTCPNAASGKGEYPHSCWSCMPDLQDRYPVLVTYTVQHVVWALADTQADAVRLVGSEPYEYTDDKVTLQSADWSVRAPDEYDWDDVYAPAYTHPYAGVKCDAHVKAYRERRRVRDRHLLLAWIDNETRDGIAEADRLTCSGCRTWVEPGHAESAYHLTTIRFAEHTREG